MMTTEERIKVMQDYLAGKEIEYRLHVGASWQRLEKGEAPSWLAFEYRIKEEKPKPQDYKQIKYKLKHQKQAWITNRCYLTLENFYDSCCIPKEDFEFVYILNNGE